MCDVHGAWCVHDMSTDALHTFAVMPGQTLGYPITGAFVARIVGFVRVCVRAMRPLLGLTRRIMCAGHIV